MDKELLRMVIIATGFLVIIGMILWSYFKSRQKEPDFLKDEAVIGASKNNTDSLKLHTEHDDFDVIPLGSAKGDDDLEWDEELESMSVKPEQEASETSFTMPQIIQFGIVANADEGFKGSKLATMFDTVGFEYGDNQVYERLNQFGEVDFGVACMIKPGTFPAGEAMKHFTCPGIVFYLQYQDMEDPRPVFDDFVETITLLARELDGVVWDHNRQPLTEATVKAIRQHL